MAIRLNTLFPTKTNAPSSAYPEGSARNVVVSGDGTGTPWDFRILNDIQGLLQSLLALAGITANGAPDEVGASQYIEALLESEIVGDDAISDVSLDKITDGDATPLAGTADQMRLSPTRLEFENLVSGGGDGSILTLQSGDGANKALEYVAGVNGQNINCNSNGVNVEAPAGTTYHLGTTVSGRGISYAAAPGGSAPGTAESLLRRCSFDASGITWIADTALGAPAWQRSTGTLTLTGIPFNNSLGVVTSQLTWRDTVTGRMYSAPVSLVFIDNGAGSAMVIDMRVTSALAPDATNMTDQLLRICYTAGSVD